MKNKINEVKVYQGSDLVQKLCNVCKNYQFQEMGMNNRPKRMSLTPFLSACLIVITLIAETQVEIEITLKLYMNQPILFRQKALRSWIKQLKVQNNCFRKAN